MASHYQAASLVSSPRYGNSIAWSDDNLVAVSCGHLITILNPDSAAGPHGLIILRPNDQFTVGLASKEDLFRPCLMPLSLSHDIRPCVRSFSWSQLGFAPDSGCLLAVCTSDGCVKLYRAPIWEYQDEWIEVENISSLFYKYMESRNFGESDNLLLVSQKGDSQANPCDVNNSHLEKSNLYRTPIKNIEKSTSVQDKPIICYSRRSRKRKAARIEGFDYDDFGENISNTRKDHLPAELRYRAFDNHVPENTSDGNRVVDDDFCSPEQVSSIPAISKCSTAQVISAELYASRIALLSALVVSWSPVISSERCCILAVGSKAGKIALWKIKMPECYSISPRTFTIDPFFVGILQAHDSWVTAISWGAISSVNLIMASGSSNGSVKLWRIDVQRVSEEAPADERFPLIHVVTPVTSVPVCLMSLIVPVPSEDKVMLAVGRGSGSVDVWISSDCEVQNAGTFDVHGQMVTGLIWSSDGHLLYSCSQDNSLHCWFFNGIHLKEVPFASNLPGLKTNADLSDVSDQCFGVALAPAESMVAVVRSFDSNLLNQMYEARNQKAVVEFFWAGPVVSSSQNTAGSVVTPDFSQYDFQSWELFILNSLKKFEDEKKVLVMWDILNALLIFKKHNPVFLENVLVKWISSWLLDSSEVELSQMVPRLKDRLGKLSSRRLHLLNIVCRRIILHNVESSEVNLLSVTAENGSPELLHTDVWDGILACSERELRERLVSLVLAVVSQQESDSSVNLSAKGNWYPVGVAQLENWIFNAAPDANEELKVLGLQIKEFGSRNKLACEYSVDEICGYCGAPVLFTSPDADWCQGSIEKHKLLRCAVSMKLCLISAPVWCCVCCKRMVDNLPPQSFFDTPSAAQRENKTLPDFHLPLVPLCPFCGILLQSPVPEFFLSKAPV